MKKLLLISLSTFLFFYLALPVFGQTNVAATFGLGADDIGDRIIAGVQWAIGIISLITIMAVIYSFIMHIVWQVRLKKFNAEHKLADQQDYTKLNSNDAEQRSAIKKKIKIYRIIISVGVFMMIVLLILWSFVTFRSAPPENIVT